VGRVRRRPSLATAIALLALFVALGGPAQATRFINGKLRKGAVGSAEVKNHSLRTRDLGKKTVRQLRTPRANSVSEVKIVNGAVTSRKLSPGAVGSAAIADRSVTAIDLAAGSVTGAQVADGSLDARDLGRFSGRFRLANPIIVARGTCWSGVPANLPPERAGVDISNDLVIVTPDATWPEKTLTFMVKTEPPTPTPGRFTLAACNQTSADATVSPTFSYLIVDLP
jgi:hypothetical protein